MPREKTFESFAHEVTRRHLRAANSLVGRQDAVKLTSVESDALANLVAAEIAAEYIRRMERLQRGKKK